MAQVWAIVILGVLLALVTSALLRWTHVRARHALVGVAVAAAGGLAGAFLILDSRMDLVPDAMEGWGVAIFIMLGSVALIIFTWLRWTQN